MPLHQRITMLLLAQVAHTVLVCESSKTDNNNNSSSSSSNSSYLRLFAVAAVIVWNCASTIGIVVVNKAVYVSYRFHFPVALSWLHVCFTAAGMASAAACGGMAAKRIPGIDRLQVAAAFAAYVVLGNLSLQVGAREDLPSCRSKLMRLHFNTLSIVYLCLYVGMKLLAHTQGSNSQACRSTHRLPMWCISRHAGVTPATLCGGGHACSSIQWGSTSC
jgi:hypothetical protein